MSISAKDISLIATGTSVEGGVKADGHLCVEGLIRGDVAVAHLFIGVAGRVEGSIASESVDMKGHVVGSITAKHVTLSAGCRMDGDVTHESLAIEAGADFQGRSLRLDRSAAPSLAAVSSRTERKSAAAGG